MDTSNSYQLGRETVRFLEGLPEEESAQVARQWRLRLLNMTPELDTTPERRDWLMHMVLHAHGLTDLKELVEQFNAAQSATPPGDVIDVRAHGLGLYFGKQAI